MADVEGFITLGSRGQMAAGIGIIGIITGREFHVGKEFLTGSLGAGGPTHQQQEYEEESGKFHSLWLFC
jgi:hypothetical protein